MRQEKLFDFKYIALALIFLIDFNVNNLDILPDFIAVLLIIKALGKAYFISEVFAEARVYLKALGAVAGVKFVTGILYFFFADGREDYNNLSMMLTFVFVIFELVLLMLIFSKIFRGLEQFAFMSGSFDSGGNARVVKNVLNIFFIVRAVLTFTVKVPTLLSEHDLDSLSMTFGTFFTRAGITSMLMIPSFIIQTLLGIFMLSIAAPFFMGISKDKKLSDFIESRITRKLTEDYFFRLRLNLKAAFALFTAGCVFFADLWLENINFLPDFMVCVLIFLGVSQISGNDREMISRKLNLYLLINLPVSIISYILNAIYEVRIFYAFADELPALANLKVFADLAYHASVILFCLIFIEFYYFIKKLQYKHMDFSSGYLNKYFTADEKILYKNKDKVLKFGAAVFCVKTLAVLLPVDDGFVPFLHAIIIIIFVVWAIKSLMSVKEDIYNYYTR